MIVDKDYKITEIADMSSSIIIFGNTGLNVEAIESSNLGDRVIGYVDGNESLVGKSVDAYTIYSKEFITLHPEAIVFSCLDIDLVCEDVKRFGDNECYSWTPDDNRNFFAIEEANNRQIDRNLKYKYIHYFNDDKFILPFYYMVKNYMNISEHLFVLQMMFYENSEVYSLVGKDNVIVSQMNDYKYLARKHNHIYETAFYKENLENAEKIILHSGWQRHEVARLVKLYGKKTELLCWGGDMDFEVDSYSAVNIFKYVNCGRGGSNFRKVMENKFSMLSKDNFGVRYAYFDANIQLKRNDRSAVRILFGHSGTSVDNHECGIELLRKFANDDIEIYAPLTYGESDYIADIIQKGKAVFGDKFIPITEHRDMKDYYEYISEMDIGFYPMNEVKGVTTISFLTLIGMPIFFFNNMHSHYRERGIKVRSLEDIEDMNFTELYEIAKGWKFKNSNISEYNRDLANRWMKMLRD